MYNDMMKCDMMKYAMLAITTIAMPLSATAQTKNDSTAIADSVFRSLPEVMVTHLQLRRLQGTPPPASGHQQVQVNAPAIPSR